MGEFIIFPAHLQHCVYPFRTEGDQERRSVSFNADFISKDELDKQMKYQEMIQQQAISEAQQAQPKPMPGTPEKLTINTAMP